MDYVENNGRAIGLFLHDCGYYTDNNTESDSDLEIGLLAITTQLRPITAQDTTSTKYRQK